MKTIRLVSLLMLAGVPATSTLAQELADEVAELRTLLTAMQQDYEARISNLESRLEIAEQQARSARSEAEDAYEIAEQTSIDMSAGASAANTFNPSLGAVLMGTYADVGSGWEEIPGFQPGGEIGSGESGFALGEAEINLKANVDDRFFGNFTFALHDEGGELEVEMEEAWLQTTALPAGFSITGGRIFSEAGYMNAFHRHTDDFADRPLPYQAFYGGQYAVDGFRGSWIAPAGLLVELGAELNWGGNFPATSTSDTSPGATTIFANLGGDVGDSHSWQAGLAYVSADAIDREAAHHEEEEDPGGGPPDAFNGDSDLTVFDFVWKWAPQGNPAIRNAKIQGEYFRRSEDGTFAGIPYDGDQDGWYLQGVWQFAPLWRVGVRHDSVTADSGPLLIGTELEDPGRDSTRTSLMLDWSPSEFSRLRLQYTNDQVLPQSDQQWFLQYIMSIGAHGAHQF